MTVNPQTSAAARAGRLAMRQRHGGGVVPALAGLALAGLFAIALYQFRDGAIDLLAMVLAASGGIYWGLAAADGRRSVVVVEALAGLFFLVVATLALWWSWHWIVAGFFLHGVWDLLHHPRAAHTGEVRRFFPPFYAAFDWAVALLVLFL
ncbi:MAG TPA: DUF6010 family protein [Longimicrobium sp.]|nr:DUF6010 family protein [Longimicrobium sp.]